MIGAIARDHLRCFADMLEYPAPALPGTVSRCQSLLAASVAGAANTLSPFADYVASTSLPLLEEAYTGIFDLDPKCHLYIGYHLFGDSYKRSAFLLGLKERFLAKGFSAGDELPDHLPVMLRYVAMTTDATEADELINEAILPALDRITGQAPPVDAEERPADAPAPEEPRRSSPYLNVLEALRLALAGDAGAASDERATSLSQCSLMTADGRRGA